jgi:hypothetical protein
VFEYNRIYKPGWGRVDADVAEWNHIAVERDADGIAICDAGDLGVLWLLRMVTRFHV